MNSIYTMITMLCWCAFFAYWFYMARKVKKAVYSQNMTLRYIYMFFIFLNFGLLYLRFFEIGWMGYQIIPHSDAWGVAGVVICIAGTSFAFWARNTLGSNWSAKVTLKKKHELIQNGPYSIVRHPIYTGFEVAVIGTAITVGQVRGVVALLIVFVAHVLKIGMEERLMHQQFPTQYEAYSKRVKRLIPFIF